MELSKEDALVIYQSASADGKTKLEELYGKELFVNKNRPISFEHACELKGVKPEDELPFPSPKNNRQQLHNVNEKLYFIAEVINNGFVADFNNPNQKKWRAWFIWDASKSAFVFSLTYCNYDNAHSNVGVRLYFENTEDAQYFGKQFIDLQNEALTL